MITNRPSTHPDTKPHVDIPISSFLPFSMETQPTIANFLQLPLSSANHTNSQRTVNPFASYFGPKYYTSSPTSFLSPDQSVLKEKSSILYVRPLRNLNSSPPAYNSSNKSINKPPDLDSLPISQINSSCWSYGVPPYSLPPIINPQKTFQEVLGSPKFIYGISNEGVSEPSKTSIQIPKPDLRFQHVQEKTVKLKDNRFKMPISSALDKKKKKSNEEQKGTSGSIRQGRDQENSSTQKRFSTGQAYDYRNVYKSVIRHMYNLTKTNKRKIKEVLIKEGFDETKIRIALETIRQYRPPDRPKDIERKSQYRVEQILKSKTIFTFILRETLLCMLDKWESGKFGQMFKTNSQLYVEAAKKLLDEVKELLKE